MSTEDINIWLLWLILILQVCLSFDFSGWLLEVSSLRTPFVKPYTIIDIMIDVGVVMLIGTSKVERIKNTDRPGSGAPGNNMAL